MELGALLRLVKNLRGIAFWAEDEDIAAELRYLRRKSQYRWVGVLEELGAAGCSSGLGDLLEGKTLKILKPPEELNAFSEIVSEALRAPPDFVRTVLAGSFYVAPVLLLGTKAVSAAEPVACAVFEAPLLSDAEQKRHLRILDYAALDAHQSATETSAKAVQAAASAWRRGEAAKAKRTLSRAVSVQARFCKEDGQTRFWRFREFEGGKPLPYVLYLQPLRFVRSALDTRDGAQAVLSLQENHPQVFAASLSVVPAFVVRVPS